MNLIRMASDESDPVISAVTAFPVEFQQTRGWNAVRGSLPFLSIVIGVLFASCVNIWGQFYYLKRFNANNKKIIPEARLMPMMIGSFFFAPGLFIMGWTSKADVHWTGFCIGAACLGFGFFTIFQSALNYLVDTYLMLAASALSANMFMRSVLAASFPLFANACKLSSFPSMSVFQSFSMLIKDSVS